MSAKDSEVGPLALRGAGWVLGGIGRPQPQAAASLVPSHPSRLLPAPLLRAGLPPSYPANWFVNQVLNLRQEEEEEEEGQAG